MSANVSYQYFTLFVWTHVWFNNLTEFESVFIQETLIALEKIPSKIS